MKHMFTIKRLLRVEFRLSLTVFSGTHRSGAVLMHTGNRQIKPRRTGEENNVF